MAKEYVEERNGGFYVSGTRVSLDSVVQCFRDGMSAETITEEFDTLTLAQVYGAIAHYLEHQPAIDLYRVRQRERFAAVRGAAEPLPDDMRKRIDAARAALRSQRAD